MIARLQALLRWLFMHVEALFNGAGGGLKMEFDPHLPQTSCTVRMSWQTR